MRSSGPPTARVAIIGDFPTEHDINRGEPFSGPAGALLTEALHKVGISRTSCFITNVCRHKPPYNPKTRTQNDISLWYSENKNAPKEGGPWVRYKDLWVNNFIHSGIEQLERELEIVKPDLVLALGNLPLYVLTGNWGIQQWRGSRLTPTDRPFTVIPSYSPASVLRELSWKPALVQDLRRAKNIFEGRQLPRIYDFAIAPGFIATIEYLDGLLAKADAGPCDLSFDIETRAGHIACLGIADSETRAIVIPFLVANPISPFFWSLDEEAAIILRVRKLIAHPNVRHIGQNYLYDCQYYYRHWFVLPQKVLDTMIAQHSLFSTLPKGLAYLSSLYAQDHVYWKDESKNWDPKLGESQLWTYNAKDACITYECASRLCETRDALKHHEHFAFQQSLFFPVLRMMIRGVRIDLDRRKTLNQELLEADIARAEMVRYLVGHDLNPKSSVQMQKFFYEDLGFTAIKHLTRGTTTADVSAMQQLAAREPILEPLIRLLLERRSIGVFRSTFVEAALDVDNRMRSSFNVAGTHSYRFSSSEDAFGSGANLQNLPKEGKKKLKNFIELPNIRQLYLPDTGYEFFDMDLDRADLQVVVWEAADSDLKRVLREGLDMHCVNACDIFGIKGIPYDELRESHPNYPEHRGRITEGKRGKAKAGVHAVNYGVGVTKLAQTLGITKREAEHFINAWFGAHPGIKAWHRRTEEQAARGYIENRFGARFYIFGRVDLPECLAWTPQSTVAGVINRALVNIDAAERRGETNIQLLLQVHDSLAGQFPIREREKSLADLKRLSQITIPYDDPLVIPVGIKTSEKSWGDCK